MEQPTQKENKLASFDQREQGFAGIVGDSRSMRELFLLLKKVIKTDSTVLITGENGTGKELVAKAIHQKGERAEKPFVVQNCSAFNDNLLDSELFAVSYTHLTLPTICSV